MRKREREREISSDLQVYRILAFIPHLSLSHQTFSSSQGVNFAEESCHLLKDFFLAYIKRKLDRAVNRIFYKLENLLLS
jgi:hypothetical protein